MSWSLVVASVGMSLPLKLLRLSKEQQDFRKEIVKVAEIFTATGTKLSEDCCRYGAENSSETILAKAASVYGDAHKHVEKEQEEFNRLLSSQDYQKLLIDLTVFAELNKDNDKPDYLKNDYDFLINVPRIERSRVLEFGNVSVDHGRDSRICSCRDSCGVLMLSWIQMWDAIERDDGYTMPYHSEKVLSIHRTHLVEGMTVTHTL